jgi:hypothetical protein
MESVEYLAGAIATCIVAGIIVYYFATQVLPWIALGAFVLVALWVVFKLLPRREKHPWA